MARRRPAQPAQKHAVKRRRGHGTARLAVPSKPRTATSGTYHAAYQIRPQRLCGRLAPAAPLPDRG